MALAIGVVIVVAGAAAGAWELTGSGGAGAAAYRVIPAVRTTLTQALSATGTIAPKTTATLTFSASGQVTAVDTEVGQHLEEGQPLAIMDSPALKAQAAQAEASLAAAQSQLSQDQASTGTSSAQLDADQASVTAAQSQADSASSALAGATLTAPIDGIVTAVGYTAGEQLSGGSSGLIASTSSGVATFPVVIDVTGTPAGLYSGASATISIIYRQLSGALAVPSGAIRPSGGRTGVVYTITAGRQVARHVTTGLAAGGLTQITSGLTAGERVVVDIPRAVKAGQSGGGPGSNTVFVGPNGGVVQFRGRPGVGPGGG